MTIPLPKTLQPIKTIVNRYYYNPPAGRRNSNQRDPFSYGQVQNTNSNYAVIPPLYINNGQKIFYPTNLNQPNNILQSYI